MWPQVAWQILTAILLVAIHRIYPPKESMKVFLENRRLFMSIRVLAHSAIRLCVMVMSAQLLPAMAIGSEATHLWGMADHPVFRINLVLSTTCDPSSPSTFSITT